MSTRTAAPVTFAAVDNHESILDALAALAARQPDRLQMVARATGVEGLDTDAPPPDVVVLDLYLGRDDTSAVIHVPDLVVWGTRVLLHTSAEFPVPVRQAVAAGAAGLSLKNDGTDALAAAVLEVAAGGFACSSTVARALLTDPGLAAELTPRELDVIQAVDDGLTHRQIARRHGVAESTVKEHLKAVRAKYVGLGRAVSNAHSLVREARRDGWIEPR